MIYFLVVPVETVTGTSNNYRGPQYFNWRFDPDPQDSVECPWSAIDYGSIDRMVIAADLTPEQLTFLQGKGDLYIFAQNLDAAIGQGALAGLQAFLEDAFIPADWLNASMTSREVIRTITGMFLFMQRLTALTGSSPLAWGVSLNTQFRNLEAAHQTAITQAYIDTGFTPTVIQQNWTMRILLKNTADQWGSRPIHFGFTDL